MRRRPRILAVVVTQQRQVTMRGSAASARHHRQAQHQSEHGEVLNLMQPGQLRAQPEVVDLSQEPDSPHAAGRAAPRGTTAAGPGRQPAPTRCTPAPATRTPSPAPGPVRHQRGRAARARSASRPYQRRQVYLPGGAPPRAQGGNRQSLSAQNLRDALSSTVGGGRGRWFLELVGPNYGAGCHCDGFYCPGISACWLRDEQHISDFRAGMFMLVALTSSGPVYACCPACALQLRTREAATMHPTDT